MTDLDMIAWMTECTIASAEYELSLSRRSKGSVGRHCTIAQRGIDYLKAGGYTPPPRAGRFFPGRVNEVMSGGATVKEWLRKS